MRISGSGSKEYDSSASSSNVIWSFQDLLNFSKTFFCTVVEDEPLTEHAAPFQAQETLRFWDEKQFQFHVI